MKKYGIAIVADKLCLLQLKALFCRKDRPKAAVMGHSALLDNGNVLVEVNFGDATRLSPDTNSCSLSLGTPAIVFGTGFARAWFSG